MNANIPVLFRTYESFEPHSNCKIWEAARATSAAPTFFKHIEIGRAQPYIDGGLGRNNPSRVVLDEAKRLFSAHHIGCLVSIGTGHAETISIKKSWGFHQIVSTDIFDTLKAITTDCEATHEAMLGLFAKLPTTYFRFNVEHGMQGIKLSEWERLGNVEAHTAHYMRKKEIEEKLALLVDAIRVPRGQLTIEQLSEQRRLSCTYIILIRNIGYPASPGPLYESTRRQTERKLCPRPVASFTGRDDILNKMRTYFDSVSESQRVFVLYGLGGAGKSQLAFKFIEEHKSKRYISIFTYLLACDIPTFIYLFSFSEIFYVDATNEQTLRADLEAIAPGNMRRSAEASLHWLASQSNGNWLLVFDNADNVDLKLNLFFPSCSFGNILVTTRNRELRHYTAKDADADVKGMDLKDAKNLLLIQARAEVSDENITLAETIVQVNFTICHFCRGINVDIRHRNFIALHWLLHRLVLSFTATHL